jgi:hypothetical protein
MTKLKPTPIRRRTPRAAAKDRAVAARINELRRRLAYLKRVGAVTDAPKGAAR